MALKGELKKFVTIFSQHTKNYGTVTFNEDVSSKTDSLDILYDTLIFDELLTVGGLMFINIETLHDLPNAQLGWYKIKNQNGNWVNDDLNWNKDYIVFANRNEDAIFYNRLDFAVYGSINKQKNLKLGDTLEEFIKILHQCMKLQQEKYNMKLQDESEAPLPEFLDDVQSILDNNNNVEVSKQFMQFFFG